MNGKYVLRILGLVCVATASLVSLVSGVVAQPRLTIVGGDTVRFGNLNPSRSSRAVVVVNEGNDTLRITEVRPSCGCTTAPLDKSVLAPGDSGTIQIKLDVALRTGAVMKPIWISSNDPVRRQIGLWLSANVLRDLASSSDFFPMIDSAHIGGAYHTSLSIVNRGDRDIVIDQSIIIPSDEMMVSIDLVDPVRINVGDSLTLSALVTPVKTGLHTARVRLHCNGVNTPELLLSIHCRTL